MIDMAKSPHQSQKNIGLYLIIVSLVFFMITLTIPKISQPLSYHDFADKRSIAGIPYGADVLSNVSIFMISSYGLICVIRRIFKGRQQKLFWLFFFFSMILVSLCSSFYHHHSQNVSLFFDRLFISTGFTSL